MGKRDEKRTSRLAAAAMICVLLAVGSMVIFCVITAIGLHVIGGPFVLIAVFAFPVAFILGLASIVLLAARPKYLKGWAWAILAVLLSAPGVFVLCVGWCVHRATQQAVKEGTAQYNLKLLYNELVSYAGDHEGRLPVADQWCDLLMNHNTRLTTENFRHPKPEMFNLKGTCHIAFNRNLGRLRLAEVPDDVVLLFEADGDWNLNGADELLVTRYRPRGFVRLLFANGETANYWFYMKGVRKFGKRGKTMYHESPRWVP